MTDADAGNTIVAQVVALIGMAAVFVPLTRIAVDLWPSDVSDAAPTARRSIDPGDPRTRFATPARIEPWHLPTAYVARTMVVPSRRARRAHTGSHRWSGLTVGQRRPHEFTHPHIVKGHAFP